MQITKGKGEDEESEEEDEDNESKGKELVVFEPQAPIRKKIVIIDPKVKKSLNRLVTPSTSQR